MISEPPSPPILPVFVRPITSDGLPDFIKVKVTFHKQDFADKITCITDGFITFPGNLRKFHRATHRKASVTF